MAHYAKVLNGTVVSVIVAEASFFDEFIDSSAGDWVQTSYNTRMGIHYDENGEPDGGEALGYNFAGIGYNYNQEDNAFYQDSPFPSWELDKTTYSWVAPVPIPDDASEEIVYDWDEASMSWVSGE